MTRLLKWILMVAWIVADPAASLAHAEQESFATVRILVQGNTSAFEVFDRFQQGQWANAFPEAYTVWTKFEVDRYRSLSHLPKPLLQDFLAAVYSNFLSWGHVMVEFSTEADRQIIGWRPYDQESLPEDHPLKKLSTEDYSTWLQKSRPLPGRFVDEQPYINKMMSLNIQPIHQLVAPLDEFQLSILQRNIASMNHDAEFSYQRPDYGKFLPNCANCVTALRHLFDGTKVDTAFIPDNGSVTSLLRALGIRHNETQSCALLFMISKAK